MARGGSFVKIIEQICRGENKLLHFFKGHIQNAISYSTKPRNKKLHLNVLNKIKRK